MIKSLKKRVKEFFQKLYTRANNTIPQPVEEYFMRRVGEFYDSKNVFVIPTDGYKDGLRGTFTRYVYRHEMFIESVRHYEDGTIQSQ